MKQETLEEASKRYSYGGREGGHRTPFLEGVKWQQERSYSEDEVIELLNFLGLEKQCLYDWFSSLKKQQE